MAENYRELACELRRQTVDIIMSGKGGHIGGDMSVMDILITLYFRQMNVTPENQDNPDRDYLIMSKGHCVEALYAVLAAKGFFSIDRVKEEYLKFGSPFIGHPNNKLPGIEMNSGSLGHGLPVGIGIALANRMSQRKNRVYVVMGDGELAEGSVWEGAMAAGMYRLDGLCAVIDRNGLQISGSTEDVMAHEDLRSRFESFGWHVEDVWQGNDSDALNQAFEHAKQVKGKPVAVIAHTVKGYGSSIMENQVSWHHHVPDQEEYKHIIQDLYERQQAVVDEREGGGE